MRNFCIFCIKPIFFTSIVIVSSSRYLFPLASSNEAVIVMLFCPSLSFIAFASAFSLWLFSIRPMSNMAFSFFISILVFSGVVVEVFFALSVISNFSLNVASLG